MPLGGAAARAEQLALLAGLRHDRATDLRIGELIHQAEADGIDPDSIEAADLREMRRDFDRASKLSRSLVEALARATSAGQHEWVAARAARDFLAFQPRLTEILDLKRQEARCLADAGGNLYDALIDEYEPGARSRDLADLFARLRAELVPLVRAIAQSPRRPDPAVLRGRVPDRPPAGLRRANRRRRWIRFSARSAGHRGAPVLLGDRPGRLPDHHAIRPPPLRRRLLGDPPRGRPRPVRPGPRPGPPRPAQRRGGVAGHPRVAIPPLGKPRRPLDSRSGPTGSRSPGRSSPKRWGASRWRRFTPRSTTSSRA